MSLFIPTANTQANLYSWHIHVVHIPHWVTGSMAGNEGRTAEGQDTGKQTDDQMGGRKNGKW